MEIPVDCWGDRPEDYVPPGGWLRTAWNYFWKHGLSQPFPHAAAPVIALDLEGGGRTLARPSGTEPKLKIYVDLPGFVPEGADPFRLEERIAAQAGSVADALAAHMGLA